MSPYIVRWPALMALSLLVSFRASPAAAQNQASVRIDDSGVLETGIGRATFNVRLLGAHGPVTVSFSTSTSGGTATQGNQCGATEDFITSAGSLAFSATDSVLQIHVTVCNDTRDEPNETFFVNLSNVSGATIQDGQGGGGILDDDPPPSLSIDDVTVTEGVGQNAAFTVALSAVSGKSVTVSFMTGAGTATGGTCAAGGFDYRAANPTLFTVAPGQPSGTITVPICDDAVREGNESFQVGLSGASNATIQDNVGVATITDNEPLPALSIITAVQTAEPVNKGPQSVPVSLSVLATFPVTLIGGPTTQTVSVRFATAPGTATAGACLMSAGLQPGDYVTRSGTLSFAPGVTTQEIQVPICRDSTADPNETFTVTLSNPVNATIAQAVGSGTIR